MNRQDTAPIVREPACPACLSADRAGRQSETRYTAELSAKDYIANYRRADYFITLCQQCGNYGKRYGCPPFDEDPLALLQKYQHVRIVGVKIVPADANLPLASANALMAPAIDRLSRELLAEEKRLNGYSFGFVGTCPHCGGAPCAREKGRPCRHPDKVRPSLEAFGFDIVKTARELLGLEIKWSKGKTMQEYLTLVCGIFY